MCLEKIVYFQYGWDYSVSADRLERRAFTRYCMTSYPVTQVKCIVQHLFWQYPSGDSVEDKWEEGGKDIERPIRRLLQ